MSLKSLMDRMSDTLSVPAAERDGEWAHENCRLSRFIHECVWERRPDPKVVSEDVIPLLRKILRAMEAVPHKGRYGKDIPKFVRNVRRRITNLRRYVAGKPSAFAPSSMLERAGASDLPPEELLEKMVAERSG